MASAVGSASGSGEVATDWAVISAPEAGSSFAVLGSTAEDAVSDVTSAADQEVQKTFQLFYV